MLWVIAWRNVWRNQKRSAIIIIAIAFGLWAGLLTMGISLGWAEQIVNSAINTRISHLQIHRRGFRDHKEISAIIPAGTATLEKIRHLPQVRAAVGRSVVAGMASSAATGTGVEIFGVVPEDEKRVTDLFTQIKYGTYFQTSKANPVIIGEKLAERLEVRVGRKIVLTAQTADGNIGAGAFRVVGIFKTVSSQFDQNCVFARRADVDRIFALRGGLHEIALLSTDVNEINSLRAAVEAQFPGLEVNSWKELAPELAMTTEMTDEMLYIFMIIILLALIFGITNTMLMGVLERVRELGVIIALGMKGARIFTMIVMETIFLSVIGGALGIIMGAITIRILSHTGIDLSLFAEGLAAFGSSDIIYPFLPLAEYPKVVFLILATAMVSSVYPGFKAVRLNPVEAIRTY